MATIQNGNFIQYGRRKGKEKLPEQVDAKELKVGLQLPNGTDLRQVKVLRRNEFNRIQDSIHAKQRALEQAKKDKLEKQKYHAEAKELVNNWPNTILGDRKKKLMAKKLREEAEEKEKKQIDLEEAKYQAEVRRKAIEEARTKQLFQTERVKGFNGALLLSEVLKERELQIKAKELIKDWGKDPGERKRMQEQLEAAEAEEREKELLRYKERKLVQSYQITQRQKREKEEQVLQEENMKEGQRLRNLHQLFEMEQEELKKLKKEQKKEVKGIYDKCVANKNAFKLLEKERNEEEDKEINIFGRSKLELSKKRAEKEKKIRKEREEKQDRMKEHVHKIYKEFEERIRTGIDYAIIDRDERDARVGEEKAKKKADMIKMIKQHRLDEMERMKKEEREEKKFNKASLAARLEADKLTREEDLAKMRESYRRSKNIQRFQIAQINDRAEAERQTRDFDLMADQKMVETSKLEEDQFRKYAQQVIEEAKSQGRNIYPLVKAARTGFGGGHGPLFEERGLVRPSYQTADRDQAEMPSFQGQSTSEVKNINDGGEASEAKKRLGFTW